MDKDKKLDKLEKHAEKHGGVYIGIPDAPAKNLTIRQHFAFEFAKIYLKGAVDFNKGNGPWDHPIEKWSVDAADSLIKVLNEEEEPPKDYSPKNIKQPHDSSCDCNDCIPF